MTATLTLTGTPKTTGARKPRAAAPGRHRANTPSTAAKIARPALAVTRRILSILTALLLTAAALALLMVTIGPRVLHYRTATMLTGSMIPTINPGDVILDTQEPVNHIAIGQIITYHIPVDDHRVESHRIIWIGHHHGHTLIRTQGDANPAPDPWTAQLGTQPVWEVRTVIPHAGSLIRTLQQPALHLTMELMLPALTITWLLITIWTPAKTTETQHDDQQDQHKKNDQKKNDDQPKDDQERDRIPIDHKS